MIQIEQVRNFFPSYIYDNSNHRKYMIKEYIQLLILDYLSSSRYIKKIAFIGGTNLRLVQGIDRFSEDLDFDCKDLSEKEFFEMTGDIISFLRRSGYKIEIRNQKNSNLKAFRQNIYFPQLLFDIGLSGHREERFLIKVESQDQKINYKKTMTNIKGCGFFFPFPVPPVEILCSMKISAMLSRQKGRDFYDVIFLLSQTNPDYDFLSKKMKIKNIKQLKSSVNKMLETVDLNQKTKDFEHLLFNKNNSKRILHIKSFFEQF